ncbi:hypothetical protein F5884DRAFT_361141 [Xylogone sp. PMI_703]|nr:hypothetical protein F5884DRAFT_361141 [Xylogone sp. PMI_703]
MHIQTINTATTMAYPSLPASPTLTNPDMILPYEGYDSPPDSPPQLSLDSNSNAWNGGMGGDMSYSLGTGQMGSVTPITPIIYGNGTMLSDIGEVTETESTISRLPKPAERRAMRAQVSHLRDSTGPTAKGIAKRQRPKEHERKMSMESTSTITSAPNQEMFGDFDDGVSVDDSVFQGDDEESVADSYSEQIVASETERLANNALKGRDDDGETSVALSRRAEQILLNAKRRLNNMEGNLSRARSSLYTSPSPSLSIHSSSPLSRTTPSPTRPDARISPQPGAASTNGLSHTTPPSPKSASGHGHSRVHSDNEIQADAQAAPYVRSASAAGYVGNSGNSVRYEGSRSAENSRPSSVISPSTRPSPPRVAAPLEPLSEDDGVHGMNGTRNSSGSGYEDGYLSPTNEYHNMSRSSSALQMRDLQNQMQDLKGRLSALRDRARDDSMKRRSMQSLRTPSPFTNAEFTEVPNHPNGVLNTDASTGHPSWSQGTREDPNHKQPRKSPGEEDHKIMEDQKRISQYSDATSIYEDVHESQFTGTRNSVVINGEHTAHNGDAVNQETYDTANEEQSRESGGDAETEFNESVNGDDEDGYESESGASTYHDAPQEQISHEDREDAFDYEHFFLHSAMGTISQQALRRRDSTGSFDSETSVETTKGPVVYTTSKDGKGDERTARGHARGGSKESISTLATFATANEGRASAVVQNAEFESFAVQQVVDRRLSASTTPKRATFDPLIHGNASGRASAPPGNWNSTRMHRPSMASIESFGSSGTTRSFPLVNKAKSQGNLKGDRSSHGDFRNDPLVAGNLFVSTDPQPSPVSMLAKEDQILVERIVASLGQCVLGLQEAGRGSTEGRAWRRRLDAARRALEGHEGAMP